MPPSPSSVLTSSDSKNARLPSRSTHGQHRDNAYSTTASTPFFALPSCVMSAFEATITEFKNYKHAQKDKTPWQRWHDAMKMEYHICSLMPWPFHAQLYSYSQSSREAPYLVPKRTEDLQLVHKELLRPLRAFTGITGADWAEDLPTRCSTSGYLNIQFRHQSDYLADCRTTAALSTCGAEYMDQTQVAMM